MRWRIHLSSAIFFGIMVWVFLRSGCGLKTALIEVGDK